MTTNRTPINRDRRTSTAPRAVDLFRQMQEVPLYGDEWWALQSKLSHELQLKPWEFPAVVPPDEMASHAPGTAAAVWFPEAQRLWCELESKA
jgi:hypothetical protein